MNVHAKGFEQSWKGMIAEKLGLNAFAPATDDELIAELLVVLQLVETDMTIFYRKLAMIDTGLESLTDAGDEVLLLTLMDAYYVPDKMTYEHKTRIGNWLRSYIKRVRDDGTPDDLRRKRMNAVNPKYVLRNYLAQLAIDRAEQGEFSMVSDLLELLRHPYDEQPGKEELAAKRPDWARQRAGCSMLSCSS